MKQSLSLEQGAVLVHLARLAVEKFVSTVSKPDNPAAVPQELLKKGRGVFVTINKLLDARKELRGCIGYPMSERPLVEAVIDVACKAASEDPRFPPVSVQELGRIVLEVSVLTSPELIRIRLPLEYMGEVKVGEHGLMVEWNLGSGLLLPQVPVELCWTAEEFLSEACMKAGATPDLWLTGRAKIYRFSAEVFAEVEPRGEVKNVRLS